MKNIDFNRLLLTIKWDTVSNWKLSLRTTLSITLGLLCIFAVDTLQTKDLGDNPEYSISHISSVAAIISFPAVLFMSICASMIFATMKTKQQRISLLMQPASNMEKFIAKMLYSTVGAAIIFLVALFAADLLRVLADFTLNQRYMGLVSVEFLRNTFTFSHNIVYFNIETSKSISDTASWLLVAEIVTAGYMAFFLGGTFFLRQPWVWTMGLIFIAVYTTGYIFASLDITPLVHNIFFRHSPISPTTLFILADIVFAAVIAFEVWASYKLFCRMQVINNKFTNL